MPRNKLQKEEAADDDKIAQDQQGHHHHAVGQVQNDQLYFPGKTAQARRRKS